jgi:hypothetical protein
VRNECSKWFLIAKEGDLGFLFASRNFFFKLKKRQKINLNLIGEYRKRQKKLIHCLGAPRPFFFLISPQRHLKRDHTGRYGWETSLIVPYDVSKPGNVIRYGQRRFPIVPYPCPHFASFRWGKQRGGGCFLQLIL